MTFRIVQREPDKMLPHCAVDVSETDTGLNMHGALTMEKNCEAPDTNRLLIWKNFLAT